MSVAIAKYDYIRARIDKLITTTAYPKVVDDAKTFLVALQNGDFDSELGKNSTLSGLVCTPVAIMVEKLTHGSSEIENQLAQEQKRQKKLAVDVSEMVLYILP